MERLTYDAAVKKAQLVERNPTELLDPLRTSMHTDVDIIALATQIQNADQMLQSSTSQKLCLILDQIRMLQAQAVKIIKESDDHRKLHNAACNFTKRPGHIYHLYERSTGQNYFSMLSPEEWNGSANQIYLGSYRLEMDMSWTPLNKITDQEEKLKWAEKCIAATHTDPNAIGTSMMAIDFKDSQ